MQKVNRNWVMVTIVVIATIVITTGTLRSSSKQQNSIWMPQAEKTPPQQRQTREEFYNQFPTADYDAPEDIAPEKREKRKLKNKRHDNKGMIGRRLPEEGDQSVLIIDSIPIPGLPVAESELVVIGEVLDAGAYVSNDKTGVYSEFTIRIDEVIKNSSASIFQGNLISVDRDGGFVRYRNGKKRLSIIGGFGMPRVGRRYMLFLSNPDNSPNYKILTGYELSADGVLNLDGFPQFMVYRGMNVLTFMNAVRQALAQSPQSSTN